MKKYFSVGEAAKTVHTTTETLRHYDRIGLVKPSKKDEWTNYRYYTEQDIVRLNTVRALQLMDLPLQEIKKVLEYDDLEKIVDFLVQAEKKADEKIAAIQYSKSKIQLAKADYERKLQALKTPNGSFIKEIPERVILLSDTLVEYIINALRLGYYCDTWLDTYYIPGKPGYEHIHMTHGVLIYAYSAENREFFALSYNSKEQYCELRIPIKAIYMACSNSYFDYIALVKNHESTIIEYDLHELCAKLSAYLNSICHDDNKRFSKKSPRQYYNYDATQKYIEEFKKVADNDDYVHLTSLYSFAEHKRIMMWRVKYISNKEKLPVDFDEAYASTIEATERLVNLGIKYNITKRKSICTNMENIMHQLCINEKLAIDELLVCVNPKYSN